MRPIITYLVVAALALHTLLGCCRHHAHAAGDDHDCLSAAETADHVADHYLACSHAYPGAVFESALANDQQADDHGAPSHRSESCEVKCAFVATNRAQIESQHDVLVVGLLTEALHGVLESPTMSPQRDRRGDAESPPPIRLHLFNQVLLI